MRTTCSIPRRPLHARLVSLGPNAQPCVTSARAARSDPEASTKTIGCAGKGLCCRHSTICVTGISVSRRPLGAHIREGFRCLSLCPPVLFPGHLSRSTDQSARRFNSEGETKKIVPAFCVRGTWCLPKRLHARRTGPIILHRQSRDQAVDVNAESTRPPAVSGTVSQPDLTRKCYPKHRRRQLPALLLFTAGLAHCRYPFLYAPHHPALLS